MDGLDALMREIVRVGAPGSPEAPFAWACLLLLALLAVACVLALRRKRPGGGEVERIFFASAAANRRIREISELDVFSRKVTAAAEDVKARIRKLRTGQYVQVKIYIDHSNFIRTWNQNAHARERPLRHDIDWAALPQVLTDEVSDWLTAQRKAPQALVYRGTSVYGTLFQDDYFKLLEGMLATEASNPDKLPLPIRLRKETIDRWREENEAHKVELMRTIQGEPGYLVVPIFRRTPREDNLGSANFTSGGIPIAPEKMLDTHIATDLIGDATFDVYDVALLVTEDSDFVPAVDFVQDMRNKTVIHVGFGPRSSELRNKCRHRIDLARNGLMRRMQRGTTAAAGTVPPQTGDGRVPRRH